MQVLSQQNYSGIPLLSVRLENLASAPGSPFGGGHVYYDTALAAVRFYTGSVWRNPLSRSDHTGSQTASTISDLASAVQGYSLDLFAAPAANLNINSKKLTSVADPTNPQDAATKNYVDSLSQSTAAGITSRPPVRAVATSNITLSGLQTVDGVSLVGNDRVLVTAQTTTTANGVYLASAGAWARASAEDQNNEMIAGATWLATEGTLYGGTQWRQATTGAITIGTTALSIVQFSAGASYTATNGVQLISAQFSVKLNSSSGLVADTNGLYLDTAIAVRKYATTIGDGSSTAIAITHNLGTQDVTVSVRSVSTNAAVEVDWTATSTTQVTISFATAPTTNSYRVVVHG